MSRARIRTIKPEMLEDEKLGRLSRDARLLFVALITMADDEGRLRASGAYIRGQRYAYDADLAAETVDRWLGELATSGVVLVYDIDGQRYAQIVNWLRHQKVNRPSLSKVPGPDGAEHVIPGACAQFSEASVNTHGGLSEASVRPQNISVLIPPTSDRHTTDRGPPTVEQRRNEVVQNAPRGVAAPSAPRLVFDHYRTHHPRAFLKPQPSSKEWKQIVERMREGATVEDLCDAIDGCHLHPFNNGTENGTKNLHLDLIMRSASNVARFAEVKRAGGVHTREPQRYESDAQKMLRRAAEMKAQEQAEHDDRPPLQGSLAMRGT